MLQRLYPAAAKRLSAAFLMEWSSSRSQCRHKKAKLISALLNSWRNSSASERTLSVVVGSSTGNICTITAPKVELDGVTDGDRAGLLASDIPISLAMSSGNDEIQLNFT